MELHPRVHVQEVGDETAVVQFETGLFFGLNEVGSEIVNLLKVGSTRDELIQSIAQNYDLTINEATQDVDVFLEELRQAKILKP